jgi:hypothetical protein
MAAGSRLSNLDTLFDTCFTTVLVISVKHLVLSLYGGLNSRVVFFWCCVAPPIQWEKPLVDWIIATGVGLVSHDIRNEAERVERNDGWRREP